MSDPLDPAAALEVAMEAARAAAIPLMSGFRDPGLVVEGKGDGSPVTAADRAGERVIREVLEGHFPRFDILGEEEGFEDRGSRYRWVVDPIDGTISYASGIPLFGTLIALEDRHLERVLLGVLNLPALGEMYAGGPGLGVRCGDTPLVIEEPPDPAEALLLIGDPCQFQMAECSDALSWLMERPLLRGYTDCFGHAMVLRGAAAAMVDPALNPWDVAASRALVEGAGGVFRLRPSAAPGRHDALLGAPRLVAALAEGLGWGDSG